MPLTASPVWHSTFTFRDRDGNQSSVSIYQPYSLGFTAVETNGAALGGELGALSDAELVGVTHSITYRDPNLIVNGAGAESDVERKGRFQFIDADYKKVTIDVPSLKNSLLVAGEPVINTADPAVSAFITDVNASARNSRGGDIIRLFRAIKAHRSDTFG